MSKVVGITITESALSSPSVVPTGIKFAYMVVIATAVQAINQNTPVIVTSKDDFLTKFTGASDTVTESVDIFFINNPNGLLLIVAGYDSTITGTGAATDKGHILKALTLLQDITDLEPGILLIPEAYTYTSQADRTTIYSAAELLAGKSDWLHFFNTATVTDTKAEALTERALYASLLGNSSLYYGIGVTNNDKQIPMSAVAAAIALRRFMEESPYAPPAGVLYPVQGLKSTIGYIKAEADFEEMRNKGINIVQRYPRAGLCFSSARTLANEIKFSQINSKTALILLKRALIDALLPLLFESSDPQGYVRREAVRRIISVLQIFYINGALSGETPEKAFRVVEVPITDVSTNSSNQIIQSLLQIQIKVYVRVVETLEEIELDLINVDIIPAA